MNQYARVLRILTLCYEWPPAGGGGGRAAKDLAEALARRGHLVRIQTVRLPGSPRFEEIGQTEVFRTWGFRKKPDRSTPLEMAGFVVTSFFPSLKHLSDFKPDLIHAHFAVPTGALALPLSLIGRVPYVLTAHLGDVPGAVPDQTDRLFRWLNGMIRPIWKHAAAVTAVSQFTAGLAREAYGTSPIVIPNGIDLSSRPSRPGAAPKSARFIFVGRLNPQKNLGFLVEVLNKLRKRSWQLQIVGEGEERPMLERQFHEAGLAERVIFHGWLDRQAVEKVLANSDLFLIPSFAEGLSVAVLEALKCGLAVIGSDIPALADTIKSGVNGYLLPINDPLQWAETIERLLTSPELLLKLRQASWDFAETFEMNRIAAQYEEEFRRSAFGVRRSAFGDGAL